MAARCGSGEATAHGAWGARRGDTTATATVAMATATARGDDAVGGGAGRRRGAAATRAQGRLGRRGCYTGFLNLVAPAAYP
uniref:Uncharacterized protein n=1 Tax=Oryza sativa subsp. japonica TaxID=39947 RepID=Q69TZ5_ORYSJ|nr:hypothetical protein [Oryza sativa Japonica Group]